MVSSVGCGYALTFWRLPNTSHCVKRIFSSTENKMKLKNWLEKQRLTNREFAKMLGVSESAIHRWTATDDGKRLPRPEYIKAIERATEGKVKPQDFYS
jgi:DNA-binding transcriptional regulator YiaG